MAGKKGMTRYTYELKERALPMHLEQGMTYAAITPQGGQAVGVGLSVRRVVWLH